MAKQRPVTVRSGGLCRAGERCFAFFCDHDVRAKACARIRRRGSLVPDLDGDSLGGGFVWLFFHLPVQGIPNIFLVAGAVLGLPSLPPCPVLPQKQQIAGACLDERRNMAVAFETLPCGLRPFFQSTAGLLLTEKLSSPNRWPRMALSSLYSPAISFCAAAECSSTSALVSAVTLVPTPADNTRHRSTQAKQFLHASVVFCTMFSF